GGDCDAFGALVRKYQGLVLAAVARRLDDRSAAEDVAQDVFVAAFRNLQRLKKPESFAAWLLSIASQKCMAWHRAEARGNLHLVSGLDAVSPQGNQPTGLPLDLESEVDRLPEKLRSAVQLCLVDGASPSDAAAELGIKPSTFRKRLHDARKLLQRQIVEKLENSSAMHLLPKDFAERCVCRCRKAQEANQRKELTMCEKKNCGCGCSTKGSNKPAEKTTAKKK
ncbi:MAG TPA: sigma-70 family RNA polymerase sigma factor, partial [Planctomycetota bacterium]|nr:sigma-70 family RNA polymerase sigma factor [Planctomycetota bacterium]